MANSKQFRRYGKRGFSRLSDAAKALIRPPLAKRGFAESRLLTDWDSVVGVQIGSLCRPLRLSHAAREGLGGTLTIGVLGARALEAQHLEPMIIERVNAHYGYRAVARIRISQVSAEMFVRAAPPPTPPQPSEAQAEFLRSTVAPVADEGLRESLERLGRNIATRERKKAGQT